MAKSKNHTNHNQNQKAHKNGITKPKRQRNESTRGVSIISVACPLNRYPNVWPYLQMCQKFLHNLRFSKKGNLSREESLKRAEERKAKFVGQPAPVKL
ncbi:AAEL004151-PD [Aedes aegypti]|uniref:60S ribosomal protein L29 n=1 Tax=Aedes aegypti TaxID=7159 RepID=Q0IFR8_AEDAE|nr:AAEL004151-PD [Aedes aegypti]